MRVNLEGLIKITSYSLPYIREMIINISSIRTKELFPKQTVYIASKFGVKGFTKALALETNLKVYAINPGLTSTRMTNFQGVNPELVAKVIVDLADGKINLESGEDIDVSDCI